MPKHQEPINRCSGKLQLSINPANLKVCTPITMITNFYVNPENVWKVVGIPPFPEPNLS